MVTIQGAPRALQMTPLVVGGVMYATSVNEAYALDARGGREIWRYTRPRSQGLAGDAATGINRGVAMLGERVFMVTGFFYVLDRLTGAVLLAEPFVKNVTWASGIGRDGRPMLTADYEPTREGQRVCPAVAGATNRPSTAFSPATGLFFLFADESCAIYTKNDQWWEAGKSFYGGVTRRAPGSSAAGRVLKGIDIETGKAAWEIHVGGGILGSGLMATAGGLVFYGSDEGFVAVDSRDGKRLWQFNTNQSWRAGPMTYTVDGDQYVAIAGGSNIFVFSLR
jgi:alcohol dehydrogenase (cytochrome c)